MRLRLFTLVVLVLGIVWHHRDARAQLGLPSESYDKSNWPSAWAERTITIPAGMIEVGLPAYAIWGQLQYSEYGITPEVDYGVSDQLTIGVSQNTDAYYPGIDPGTGVPYSGWKADYQGLDPHVLFRFLGESDLGVRLALPVHLFNSFYLDANATIDGRLVSPGRRVALLFDGGLWIQNVVASGVDDGMGGTISVPRHTIPHVGSTFVLQSAPNLALAANLHFYLDTYSDQFSGSHTDTALETGLLALYNLNPGLDLNASFDIPDIKDGFDTIRLSAGVTLWR